MTMRILIADDHAIVRRGLRQILSDISDMDVAGEASSGVELLELVRSDRWDAIVLDLNMPGPGGLDVLQELKHIRPDLPVLILSIHGAEQYALRMLKAGAAGYLNKESAPELLVEAIRKIVAGGRFLTPQVSDMLAEHLVEPSADAPHLSLSDREFQVMCALASGKRIKDIASELSLSPKTISTYRRRALNKLGMTSDIEWVQYALGAGLIPPRPDKLSPASSHP